MLCRLWLANQYLHTNTLTHIRMLLFEYEIYKNMINEYWKNIFMYKENWFVFYFESICQLLNQIRLETTTFSIGSISKSIRDIGSSVEHSQNSEPMYLPSRRCISSERTLPYGGSVVTISIRRTACLH